MPIKENIRGALLIAQQATRGTAKVALDVLDANIFVEVISVGDSGVTQIPDGWRVAGAVFKTPDAGETAITLATGDSVYPLTLATLCKTECNYSYEKGTIEVSDDCPENDGYVASIVDGFVDIKGNLNGFMKIDETTKELVDASQVILNKFVDIGTDDGAGTYVHTAKNDDSILFFICLNKKAAVGERQNWLILKVHYTSLSGGAALKDAQKKDIAWVKAPGPAIIYIRTVKSAADVIDLTV